jgi:hypothetical protein
MAFTVVYIDFTGKFCSGGKYPIAQAVKSVLETSDESVVVVELVPRINYETDFITTRITQFIRINEVKRVSLDKFSSLRKFSNSNSEVITSEKKNNLEEKPLSYFQLMYKKYKSLSSNKILSCQGMEKCYYYLKASNNKSSSLLFVRSWVHFISVAFLTSFFAHFLL